MNRATLLLPALAALLFSCKPEAHVTHRDAIEPPVAAADAIPDAPVNGSIRGVPFTIRDARYIADHREGYARVDIKLSAGKAEASCDDVKPNDSTSVWLRLEGKDELVSQNIELRPGKESPWSVHYQVKADGEWIGNGDGSAVIALHAAGADGKLSGGIAVCFADGMKSCVSGSFDAEPCPSRIDAPVRGAQPPEAIPEKYRDKLKAVRPVVPPVPAPAPSGSASAGAPPKP
ncbi:MAG: hypothetical protein U0359_14575 [Byssovorax sp.]